MTWSVMPLKEIWNKQIYFNKLKVVRDSFYVVEDSVIIQEFDS